jgi:hypothetical protein
MNTNDISVEDIVKEDIFNLLGATGLTDEEKKKIYEKMLETLNYRVVEKVSGMLTDEELDKWCAFAKEGKEKEANDFLIQKNINIQEIMENESLIYKTELVAYSQYLKKTGKAASSLIKTLEDKNKQK